MEIAAAKHPDLRETGRTVAGMGGELSCCFPVSM